VAGHMPYARQTEKNCFVRTNDEAPRHDLKTLFTHGAVAPTEDLEITVGHREAGALVHLNGRLDIDSSPLLRDRLLAILLEQSMSAVTIDLAKVSYLDSSGVATLIEGLKFACQRGIALRLAGLEGRLLHLFETTGVLRLFNTDGVGSATSSSRVS